jgi:hypothetical protein
MATKLANPFPAGPRFIHNTASKVGQQPEPAPALTGQAPAVFLKAVTITPEARRIARGLGIREAEYLVQRVLDAETTVQQLVARVSELERQGQLAPHLAKVERRA